MKPSEFDSLVMADEMPPCPLCGRPIEVPPATDADRPMVFIAHGRAALGHDGCRPRDTETEDGRPTLT